MKVKWIIYYAAIAIFITACRSKSETLETSDFKINGDTVAVSDKSALLKKLITQKVTKDKYNFDLVTSGVVKAIPNNFAQITPPFAGRITKSYVRLGQKVDAGSPIFEISSSSFYETGKDYYEAKQEMELAGKNLKRERDLLTKGVGVQKDEEEAEVNYELKKKDYENALASLKVFQINPDELVLGQPLIVRSPIKGIIVDNKIVIGLYVKEDFGPVVTVAELSKIWVEAQVKEKDIRFIHESDEVEIKPVSFPDSIIKGIIYYVNSILDEETRSVGVIIECDNKNIIMKPGMYVAVNFNNAIDNTIVVPSKAVFQMDDNSFVYLSIGKNMYIKRKIKTIKEEKDKVIVASGLHENDNIIIEGGFYLLDQK